MKGIYTIEKIKRNGIVETIIIPNLLNKYFTKEFNADSFPKTVVFFSEEYCPVVTGEEFSLPERYLYTSYKTDKYYSPPGFFPWTQYCDDLVFEQISVTGKAVLSDGKHTYYATNYITGPFNACGIGIFYNYSYGAGKYGTAPFYYINRIFSATNITPDLVVKSNEQIKIKYDLIQEWE